MNLNRPFDYRYIYVLGNSRHLFRYKIGISDNVSRRTREIEDGLAGDTFEIFAAKFFFSQKIETFLHFLYSPLHARMHGSGRTEWFWMFLPITPTILLAIFWIMQWIIIPIFISVIAFFYLNWDHLGIAIHNFLQNFRF